MEIIYYGVHCFQRQDIVLFANEVSVYGLHFLHEEMQVHLGLASKRFKEAKLIQNDLLTGVWVDALYGSRVDSIPVTLVGTDFQKRVWRQLKRIPPGEVWTYGDVAASLNCLSHIRAVANAIGRNFIAYLIPCHRVVGKNGHLTGYRWGLSRKKMLLEAEGVFCDEQFFVKER